jgi:hypothetical protein
VLKGLVVEVSIEAVELAGCPVVLAVPGPMPSFPLVTVLHAPTDWSSPSSYSFLPAPAVILKGTTKTPLVALEARETPEFKNRNSVIYHNADWIAGVDYDDPNDIENDETEDEEYDKKEDENEDQLEQYKELEEQLEHIDPEEIEDIIRDARGETNPNMQEQHDNANEEELEYPVEQQEVPAEPTRRLTRETSPIERLEPKMSGKSYMQEQKKVNFECDAEQEL